MKQTELNVDRDTSQPQMGIESYEDFNFPTEITSLSTFNNSDVTYDLRLHPDVERLINAHKIFFRDIDIEGLCCIFAFLGSYQLHEQFPLWLHVVGGPSSGKTEVGLAAINDAADDHTLVDQIGLNTLLSGLTKGNNKGKYNSLLHRIGPQGLIVMPDFTTMIEQPDQIVAGVAGQLRKVFDGSLSRQTGMDNPNARWDGLISIITAMTPPAFAAWGKYNLMGERFLALQWKAPANSDEITSAILEGTNDSQLSPKQILSRMCHRILLGTSHMPDSYKLPEEFNFSPTYSKLSDNPKPTLSREILESCKRSGQNVTKMAEVLATLRTVPKRHGRAQQIGRMDTSEAPFRILHQLLKVIRGWAYINRREPINDDINLARRIGLDSIPTDRRIIIETLWRPSSTWVSTEHLYKACGFVETEPIFRHLEDLYALKVIETQNDSLEHRSSLSSDWKLTQSFRSILTEAFGGL